MRRLHEHSAETARASPQIPEDPGGPKQRNHHLTSRSRAAPLPLPAGGSGRPSDRGPGRAAERAATGPDRTGPGESRRSLTNAPLPSPPPPPTAPQEPGAAPGGRRPALNPARPRQEPRRDRPYHTSLTKSSKAPGRTKSSLPMAHRLPNTTRPGILRAAAAAAPWRPPEHRRRRPAAPAGHTARPRGRRDVTAARRHHAPPCGHAALPHPHPPPPRRLGPAAHAPLGGTGFPAVPRAASRRGFWARRLGGGKATREAGLAPPGRGGGRRMRRACGQRRRPRDGDSARETAAAQRRKKVTSRKGDDDKKAQG